jgi:hypothetical protein
MSAGGFGNNVSALGGSNISNAYSAGLAAQLASKTQYSINQGEFTNSPNASATTNPDGTVTISNLSEFDVPNVKGISIAGVATTPIVTLAWAVVSISTNILGPYTPIKTPYGLDNWMITTSNQNMNTEDAQSGSIYYLLAGTQTNIGIGAATDLLAAADPSTVGTSGFFKIFTMYLGFQV